jgi:hypothetical protein
MDTFVKAGGSIWTCAPCFKRCKLEQGSLSADATLVGGTKLVAFLSDGTPCISY